MNRTARLSIFCLALAVAAPAFAEDPPPPPADERNSSESTWRRSGALLDRSPQHRSNVLSVFAGLPYGYWGYGFPIGVGGRFLIPFVQDGFISSLNDSFGIEFGVDLTASFGTLFYPSLGIPVEAIWQFYLTPKFSVYAKAGAVLEVNFVTYCGAVGFCRGVVSASPIANVGLFFRLSEKLSLRAEVGYPWIKVGLGFDM